MNETILKVQETAEALDGLAKLEDWREFSEQEQSRLMLSVLRLESAILALKAPRSAPTTTYACPDCSNSLTVNVSIF